MILPSPRPPCSSVFELASGPLTGKQQALTAIAKCKEEPSGEDKLENTGQHHGDGTAIFLPGHVAVKPQGTARKPDVRRPRSAP